MWFDLARELAAETEEANDGEDCSEEQEIGSGKPKRIEWAIITRTLHLDSHGHRSLWEP
jgi:hypothetical protein